MPSDQIGVATKEGAKVVLRLRAEGPGGILGDAFFDYPSIKAARAAGWNIPDTPRGRSSVPVYAVEDGDT